MKRVITTTFVMLASLLVASAQSFDFEDLDPHSGMPKGWMRYTTTVGVDSLIRHSGDYSLHLNGAYPIAVTQMPFLYAGRELQLSGYICADKLDGRAEIQAILRAGSNAILKPEDHIVTRSVFIDENTGGEWQKFSFQVPLCPQMTSLQLTIFLHGSGNIWVDDIEILVDGQILSAVATRAGVNISYKAEEDRRFESGSQFTVSEELTPQQIENLTVLSRVWGFLKYYHPAVARGEYNWDYELFAILPQIIDLEPQQRNRKLYEWVRGLGEFSPGEKAPQVPVKWISDEELLGRDLSNILLSIANSEREVFNYYLTTIYGTGQAFHKNENPYPAMDYSDTGVKLAAVFRLWNAIEYYYPYKHLTNNWDEALEIAIRNVSRSIDKTDYILSLHKLLSRINDSHGLIQDPEQTVLKSYKFFVPFAAQSYVDGKFVVTHAFGPDTLNNLRKGDAILSIGDQSVAEFLAEMKEMIPSSNLGTLARDVAEANVINATSSQDVIYTVDRDGTIIRQKTKAYPLEEFYQMVMAYSASLERVSHKVINDSIAYIHMERIPREDLDSVFSACVKYPNLILDMRGYPDTNVMNYISRLVPGFPVTVIWIKPDMNFPGSFIALPTNYIGGGEVGVIPSRIAVLVNQQTQSMPEYMVMVLQSNPNVVTVGSQTAGADGNITNLLLPGNLTAVFTGIGVLYPDGGETQGVGIRIDEYVSPTLEGIRQGRDEQLERALEILTN